MPHCWHSASYTSKWPHSSVGPVGTTGLRVSSCFVSFSQFLAVSNVYCLRHHTLRQLVHHASESPGEVGNWTKFRSGALAVGWAVLSTTIAGSVSTCTVLPKVVILLLFSELSFVWIETIWKQNTDVPKNDACNVCRCPASSTKFAGDSICSCRRPLPSSGVSDKRSL